MLLVRASITITTPSLLTSELGVVFNLTTTFIDIFAGLGLVWGRKKVSQAAVLKAVDQIPNTNGTRPTFKRGGENGRTLKVKSFATVGCLMTARSA